VQVYFAANSSVEYIRAGRLRALAVWNGLWVPKGTPKNITVKLNAAVMDALVAPTVRARLADLGQEVFPTVRQTPEALAAFQKSKNGGP
jgi:tripartite-type tricarboxylate transporter receptor subunit TctC